jgi:carotenoid 1,2-hydratase
MAEQRDGPPDFTEQIPPGGYLWWYLDGMSDDRQHGITIIAFVGSVFSPYYHWSGRTDPENHVAVNVALYGARGHRWAMTERGRGQLERTPTTFRVGPSALRWERDGLTLNLDERAIPHLSAIRGTIRLEPRVLNVQTFELNPAGGHMWRPIAPFGRLSVDLESPDLSWSGDGYFDTNRGDEPLEDGFVGWDWSRAALGAAGGDTQAGAAVLYDMHRRDGSKHGLALRFRPDGSIEPFSPPPRVPLATTLWRVPRRIQADTTEGVAVRRTLEDAPFYARSMVDTRLLGERVEAMHESLDMDRFRSPIVKLMLPFRMPRRT